MSASRIGAFFAELKRRRVVRVATVYGIVGIAVVEATDVVVPALGLPASLVSAIVVLTLLGFPIAIGLAWAFDFRPDGLVRAESGDDAERAAATGGPILSRRSWAAIVPSLAVIILLLFWSPLDRGVSSVAGLAGAEYLDSVAIMPLDNMTGIGRMDALGIGLAEEIISQLQRIRPLKTINSHSVRSAASQGLPLPELARQLGVQHIVRGWMDTTETGLRIHLQHFDVATGAEIWTREWDAPLAEPDNARDAIAWDATRLVLDAMPLIPRPDDFQDIQHGPGQSAYQLGKYWMGRRTPEGLTRAIENLIEAILLDNSNALAYSDLASTYALALTYRYEIGLDGYATAGRALTLAERALHLNPDGVGGYASRGYLGAIINAPLLRVNSDFRRAIELQPNAASVASWSARALEMAGQAEDALAQAERAAELDPLAAGRHIAVAYLSVQLGRYDRAIEAARLAQQLEPELVLSRAIEGRALLLAGRPDECAALQLGPHQVLRATCLWEAGETAAADSIVRQVEDMTRQNISLDPEFAPVLQAEDLAVHHAWTGNAEASLEWIRTAYDLSPTGLEIRVWESALFDRVRDTAFADSVGTLRAGLFQKVLRGTL